MKSTKKADSEVIVSARDVTTQQMSAQKRTRSFKRRLGVNVVSIDEAGLMRTRTLKRVIDIAMDHGYVHFAADILLSPKSCASKLLALAPTRIDAAG